MRTQATTPPRLTALHPQRHALVGLNVLGGLAVLGSYAYELTAHAGTSEALWGAVPDALRPFYTISMVMAAIGYFPLTLFLFFGVDPDRTRIGGRFGYGVLVVLYALILVPSALWMPLTFAMVEQPGAALWVAIRLVLALVALGSAGLLGALVTLTPPGSGGAYWLAVGGAVAFCVQTVLLDALVWPAFFPVP